MEKIIYLDNASTTAVHQDVLSSLLPYITENYGNASSPHALGDSAQKALNQARIELARELGVKAQEIIFTSGGTESNNLALFGLARANKDKKKIIISSIEHSSIYESAISLKEQGYEVVVVPVDNQGLVDVKMLEKEINSSTLLVSVIHANNEIGVVQDLAKIGALCRKKGGTFHTDAVQSFGKERINAKNIGIDLLSASAHKLGGMKGIGFLYVREGLDIEPLIIGGGQELGKRAGTENIPAIVSFAKALQMTRKDNIKEIKSLRDYFISELEKLGAKLNGSKESRIYNNVNVSLPANAEKLVLYLSSKGIMCSTRSACLSKQKKENRVLKALGLNKKDIDGTIRFTLSRETTKKDLDVVLKEIASFL